MGWFLKPVFLCAHHHHKIFTSWRPQHGVRSGRESLPKLKTLKLRLWLKRLEVRRGERLREREKRERKSQFGKVKVDELPVIHLPQCATSTCWLRVRAVVVVVSYLANFERASERQTRNSLRKINLSTLDEHSVIVLRVNFVCKTDELRHATGTGKSRTRGNIHNAPCARAD